MKVKKNLEIKGFHAVWEKVIKRFYIIFNNTTAQRESLHKSDKPVTHQRPAGPTPYFKSRCTEA